MIKFISDYVALGFVFMFKECLNCGNIGVMISRRVEKNGKVIGILTSNVCVERKLFEDEDALLAELSSEMHNIIIREDDVL